MKTAWKAARALAIGLNLTKRSALTCAFMISILVVVPSLANNENAKKIIPILMMLLEDEQLKVEIEIVGSDDEQVLKGTDFFADLLFPGKEGGDYTYRVVDGSLNAEVTETGILRYRPLLSDPTGEKIIEIELTDAQTQKSQIIEVTAYLLETEVLASGSVGPAGGLISDDWQDVYVQIPEGTLSSTSEIFIVGGYKLDGSYLHQMITNASMSSAVPLRTPRLATNLPESKASKFKAPSFSKSDSQVSDSMQETLWLNWPADYLEVRYIDKNNAINRVPSDTDLLVHALPNVRKRSVADASSLYSLCGDHFEYEEKCGGRMPILFVHGFSADAEGDVQIPFIFSGGQGGGEDTWGQFRQLIHNHEAGGQKNYAVFEFRWRTNSTFYDASDDLASAINAVSTISGRKVHVVAHSFGGLLARTYLQNYARNFPYANNVGSLVTLGTPHSGIFDTETTIEGTNYPPGQDNEAQIFETCLQSSCYEAGEDVPAAYTARNSTLGCSPGFLTSFACISPIGEENIVPIKGFLGMSDRPGGLIHFLQSEMPGHELSVPTKVLIGLTRKFPNNEFSGFSIDCSRRADWENIPYRDRFESGDALISFAGQRFLRTSGDSPVNPKTNFSSLPGGEVTENILGISPIGINETIPGGYVPASEAFSDVNGSCVRLANKGYRHTSKLGLLTTRGSVNEVEVNDALVIGEMGEKHDSLAEVIDWLKNQENNVYSSVQFNINVQLLDALDGSPIVGGKVEVFIAKSPEGEGVSDADGNISITTPFVRSGSYVLSVSSSEYRAVEIPLLYPPTKKLSDWSLPPIRLQPDNLTLGSVNGIVRDISTGYPISEATVNLVRNGLTFSFQTSEQGEYSQDDLVAGIYNVAVIKEGYQTFERMSVVVVGDQTNTINIGLERPDIIQLNDTGVVKGVNYPVGINDDCSGIEIELQDCSTGRDAYAGLDIDGVRGFNFTKLDDDGDELPPFAASWSCVKDNVTGLIWENKTRDGSVSDQSNRVQWDQLGSKLTEINSIGRCGFSDWRLPSPQEMLSMVSYGVSPTIDRNYFPEATGTSNGRFWTKLDIHRAFQYYVEFGLGELHDAQIDFGASFNYRFVRGDNPLESHFVDNGDGTVTDVNLGLMWQKCTVGLSGASCEQGTLQNFNLSTAFDHVNAENDAGDYDDWRIPNIKEAYSQIYYQHINPSSDNIFPNTVPGGILSSTYSPRRGVQSNALDQVYIPTGVTGVISKERDLSIWRLRLVRNIR